MLSKSTPCISFRNILSLALLSCYFSVQMSAQHNAGMSCTECHTDFKLAGTVFTDSSASVTSATATVHLISQEGYLTELNPSDAYGNIHELKLAAYIPEISGSQVNIGGQTFSFDPSEFSISTIRGDIFAPGYFSMFDVILAVAEKNDISIEYEFDSTRI